MYLIRELPTNPRACQWSSLRHLFRLWTNAPQFPSHFRLRSLITRSLLQGVTQTYRFPTLSWRALERLLCSLCLLGRAICLSYHLYTRIPSLQKHSCLTFDQGFMLPQTHRQLILRPIICVAIICSCSIHLDLCIGGLFLLPSSRTSQYFVGQ